MDTFILYANTLLCLGVIALSFILFVKDSSFNPAKAHTKLGKWLAWGSRVGLATIVVTNFRFVLDYWLEMPHNGPTELMFWTALVLVLGRLAQKTFRSSVEVDLAPGKVFTHAGYVGLLTLVFGAFWLGPKIEEKFFPVIDNVVVSNVVRSSEQVCWKWTYDKVRDATAEYAVYFVRESDGKMFDTQVIRSDTGESFTLKKRRSGGTYDVGLCAEIPAHLRWESGLKLVSEIKYQTHNVWPVFYRFPQLDIPEQK